MEQIQRKRAKDTHVKYLVIWIWLKLLWNRCKLNAHANKRPVLMVWMGPWDMRWASGANALGVLWASWCTRTRARVYLDTVSFSRIPKRRGLTHLSLWSRAFLFLASLSYNSHLCMLRDRQDDGANTTQKGKRHSRQIPGNMNLT